MTDPKAIADAIDPRKQGWSDASHPLEVYQVAVNDGIAAADLLLVQAVEIARLKEALKWYGENARLCRLLHSEGDPGRHALVNDGGKLANAALSPPEEPKP
jgi:hypothetical protein